MDARSNFRITEAMLRDAEYVREATPEEAEVIAREEECTDAEKMENSLRMHRAVADYLKKHYPAAYDEALEAWVRAELTSGRDR